MSSFKRNITQINAMMAAAIQHHQQGDFPEAETFYRQVLDAVPGHIDALHMLGLLAHQAGYPEDAVNFIGKAVRIDKKSPAAFNHLGAAYRALGQLQEAEKCYRNALKLKYDFAEAHYNLANLLADLKQFKEAEAAYKNAIKFKPYYAEAYCNLSPVLIALGNGEMCQQLRLSKLQQAEEFCKIALSIKSDYAVAYFNLGNSLDALEKYDEAVAAYENAISIKSDYIEAFNRLGDSLVFLERYDDALRAYYGAALPSNYWSETDQIADLLKFEQSEDSCLEVHNGLSNKPNYAVAYFNLGSRLDALKRYDKAVVAYERAIFIKPDYATALYSQGNSLSALERYDDALDVYRKAILLEPDYAEAYFALGVTHNNLGDKAAAVVCYRDALRIKPDMDYVLSSLLFEMNYYVREYNSNYLSDALRYGEIVQQRAAEMFSRWKCVSNPLRLKVGMVSGDFRNHPVGYFIEGVLNNLDKQRIDVIGYSTNSIEDELTARIKPLFLSWKLLSKFSDADAANMIHSDGVHILIDLSGHTAGHRLPVLAWKPAPIQVSWLGYFDTTGVAQIDYILGDPHVTPYSEQSHFKEKIWQLPERFQCFTPPDSCAEVNKLPVLTKGDITFGCFNNLQKINEAVVFVWSKILTSMPGSTLFLKTKQLESSSWRNLLIKQFLYYGVEEGRLRLEGAVNRDVYLSLYNEVDIALDPFPYNGGTTSIEGLWMGVPFITLKGNNFVSHMGESILHNVGLPDWIAVDEDDYVAKAVRFASDIEGLARLRAGLRQQLTVSPVCDAPRFARHFEDALWGMWWQYEKRSEASKPDTGQ